MHDDVEDVVDIVDQFRCCRAGTLRFLHARLDGVRQLAEIHRPGHARTALERMEQTSQSTDYFAVGRVAAPGAQLRGNALVEFERFLQKQRQELLVKFVLQLRNRDRLGIESRHGLGACWR